MKISVSHLAWDEGILTEAIESVLGVKLQQKSSKTMCGIRVPMKLINNKGYTCAACRFEVQKQEQMARIITAMEDLPDGRSSEVVVRTEGGDVKSYGRH